MRVSDAALADGDEMAIGRTRLRYMAPAPAALESLVGDRPLASA